MALNKLLQDVNDIAAVVDARSLRPPIEPDSNPLVAAIPRGSMPHSAALTWRHAS